jgi:hypothetical protein
MSKARKRRKRKLRRQFKQSMRHRGAKPAHRLIGGRTGGLHYHRMKEHSV